MVGLKPNRAKFQCLGTTDGALKDAPGWLKPKAIDILDPVSGDMVLDGTGSSIEPCFSFGESCSFGALHFLAFLGGQRFFHQ
jgi:hypothetical protein